MIHGPQDRLRVFPDPALRLRANEVDSFDEDLERLVGEMVETLSALGGVGLAANQVGVLRRVVLVRHEDLAYALVNPRLISSTTETNVLEEGCLSLPGVPVPVERSLAVSIAAKSPTGEPIELELEGYPARIVQHELDHLDGVLIVDRVPDYARAGVRRALRELLRS